MDAQELLNEWYFNNKSFEAILGPGDRQHIAILLQKVWDAACIAQVENVTICNCIFGPHIEDTRPEFNIESL